MINYKKAAFVGGGIGLVGALAFGLKTLYEYKEYERVHLPVTATQQFCVCEAFHDRQTYI